MTVTPELLALAGVALRDKDVVLVAVDFPDWATLNSLPFWAIALSTASRPRPTPFATDLAADKNLEEVVVVPALVLP